MQFQPDARSTKLHLPVRFVYDQNLPAGQSTAVDMLRRCHADACTICCMQAAESPSKSSLCGEMFRQVSHCGCKSKSGGERPNNVVTSYDGERYRSHKHRAHPGLP